MQTKDIQNFRWWYKCLQRGRINDPNTDENFVGTYHKRDGLPTINGFFEMYHGDKGDIPGYLPSILKIAEDSQAIYEFIQNAVDCGSTEFAVFYNSDYFLAINNGKPFQQEEVQSILNIAQSPKKSCDKIGRFGIGFKLVHRLVGKDDGTKELTKDYKGPIVYSWTKAEDLKGLAEKQQIQKIQHHRDNVLGYHQAAWLFKILLTNFPAGVGEEVKDLNYAPIVPFPMEELEELQGFLHENFSTHLDWHRYQTGSLFFLKLGEDKRHLLDDEKAHLERGISYSMNMLKRLEKVYLNDTIIQKEPLKLIPFTIHRHTEEFNRISPEYKDCDIKATLGYYPDFLNAQKLKDSPNIFKYFPMGDEANGFSFILHCDSFDNEANRRKLMESNANRWLLNTLARQITEAVDGLNEENTWPDFLQLYATLLLSDIPEKENKVWMLDPFYSPLLNFMQKNVPGQNRRTHIAADVKLKRTKLRVTPADFGCDGIFWFYWPVNEENKIIIDAAKGEKKLALEGWKISDLIRNGRIEKMNEFLIRLELASQQTFWEELRKEVSNYQWMTEEAFLFTKFKNLKIFKFSDGHYYSLNELLQNVSSHLLIPAALAPIQPLLQKAGFSISDLMIDESNPSELENLIIQETPYLKDKIKLFTIINQKLRVGSFSIGEKQLIFKTLRLVNGINYGTLRAIELFKNRAGQVMRLDKMINGAVSVSSWLQPFQIDQNEYFNLIKEECFVQDIYGEIVYPNWEAITQSIQQTGVGISAFYQTIVQLYEEKQGTPLNGHSYVFTTGKTFEPEEEVYFDGNLCSQEEGELVSKITRLKIPAPEVIPFLSKAPFKTERKSFIGHIKFGRNQLGANEAQVLMDFCEKRDIKLLEHGYFTHSFELVLSMERKQYYSPEDEVNNFINQRYSNKFAPLPATMELQQAKKLGLLYGSNFLTDCLIPLINPFSFKEFILCGTLEKVGVTVQIAYLKRVIVDLSLRVILDGQNEQNRSFLPVFINKCFEHFGPGHEYFEKLRSNLYLPGLDAQPLSQLSVQPDFVEIESNGENKALKLSFDKLLPDEADQVTGAISLARFAFGEKIPRLEELLSIEEMTLETIWTRLSSSDCMITEPEQFAFLALYCQGEDKPKFPEEKDFSSVGLMPVVQLFFDAGITSWKDKFNFLNPGVGLKYYYPSAMVFDDEEKMPIALESWMNEGLEREKYLGKLGVNTRQNDWYKIRKILTTGQDIENAEEILARLKKDEFSILDLVAKIIKHRVVTCKWDDPRLPHFNNIFQFLAQKFDQVHFVVAAMAENHEFSVLMRLTKGSNASVMDKLYSLKPEHEKYLGSFLSQLDENSYVTLAAYAQHVEYATPAETEINEQALDLIAALSDFSEWDAPEYENWGRGIKIYLHGGEIPYHITIFGKEVPGSKFQSGDIIRQKNLVFVNKHASIRELLRKELTEEEYNSLYSLPEINEIGRKLAEEGIRSLTDIEALIALKRRMDEPPAYVQPEPGDNRPAEVNDGVSGEILIYNELTRQFGKERVKWVAPEGEPRYDIKVLNEQGDEVQYYIDVKSTITGEFEADKIPINIRNGEWRFLMSDEAQGKYYIARIFNVNSGTPTIRWLKVDFAGNAVQQFLQANKLAESTQKSA